MLAELPSWMRPFQIRPRRKPAPEENHKPHDLRADIGRIVMGGVDGFLLGAALGFVYSRTGGFVAGFAVSCVGVVWGYAFGVETPRRWLVRYYLCGAAFVMFMVRSPMFVRALEWLTQ